MIPATNSKCYANTHANGVDVNYIEMTVEIAVTNLNTKPVRRPEAAPLCRNH